MEHLIFSDKVAVNHSDILRRFFYKIVYHERQFLKVFISILHNNLLKFSYQTLFITNNDHSIFSFQNHYI